MRHSTTVDLLSEDEETLTTYEVTYHWVEDSNGMEGTPYFDDCSHIEIDWVKVEGVKVEFDQDLGERLEEAIYDEIAHGII